MKNVSSTQITTELLNSVIEKLNVIEELKKMLVLSTQSFSNKRNGISGFTDVQCTIINNFLVERVGVLSTLVNLSSTQSNVTEVSILGTPDVSNTPVNVSSTPDVPSTQKPVIDEAYIQELKKKAKLTNDEKTIIRNFETGYDEAEQKRAYEELKKQKLENPTDDDDLDNSLPF